MTQKAEFNNNEEALITSLKVQPLIIVLRISEQELDKFGSKPIRDLIETLTEAGVRHIELAWCPGKNWIIVMKELKQVFKDTLLGAASINNSMALCTVAELNLQYAMTPTWDPKLQAEARDIGQLLIPGVFSPSEIKQAANFNCQIIKLFPASQLGWNYLNQIQTPLKELPFVIAAGGLQITDINHWINAGYGAIAIGRSLKQSQDIDPILATWLRKKSPQRGNYQRLH